ncbi:hypothetical protein GGU10DRAFT_303087 [Lentinula aff. detonsa]|uniref:Uncharacterized protein n=1 Tax=Lentinula aff. detonsa TaxID=2804958 RepID=A0AA38NSJ6_9AGAR|nr:hypothetical protein GGU10DRAFT_303087 [Lentinula aff. detonsa]
MIKSDSDASPQARWIITEVQNPLKLDLWVSDGKPVEGVAREGSANLSYRLIVQNRGFLDITTIQVNPGVDKQDTIYIFDFNGRRCACTAAADEFQLNLSLLANGSFSVAIQNSPVQSPTISGSFKPFPNISDVDVAYIDEMILKKYVPYQKIPDEVGRPDQEIRALGKRFFPWSPHSYQLAMCIYDWTTASFTRMVFMKVFQYTSIDVTPTPLDLSSIASMIWESNWDSYKPSDSVFMNSFMMKPADEEADVQQQLKQVYQELHRFSDIQNHLLAAAAHSLPRTCILAKPYLFSGQVDIYQMGMSRFGIEMLQFPGNDGPVGQALEVAYATATATFIRPGSFITTKMVWSFTDSEADARHYSNGILLIAEPPATSLSFVWDEPAYITELSDGPEKIEYIFPPGTKFNVLSIDSASDGIQIIRLQVVDAAAAEIIVPSLPVSSNLLSDAAKQDALREALSAAEEAKHAEDETGVDVALAQSMKVIIPALDQIPLGEPPKINHVEAKKTNGRRCRCVETTEG